MHSPGRREFEHDIDGGAAEDLCASKIEALRSAAPALALADAGPAPAAPEMKKCGGRQLAFMLE
jgi:hypothetical protein